MKQRMKLLALILAGTIAVGGSGLIYVEAADVRMPSGAVAGVSTVFTELLTTETAEKAAKETGQQVQPVPGQEVQPVAADLNAENAVATASEHEVPVVASEYADVAIAQVNNYVNVRMEPNTESEVLGKLYNNSAATVLSAAADGWYRIQSGNVEGYVKAEYVVVGNEELAREVSTRYATVTTTTLFVRSEPTTEASVLTMLPKGDDLVALDESTEGWVKVSTVEGEGYVSADYVTLSTEYIHAESKAEEEARLAREEAERQAAARAAEEARLAREAEERRAREAEAARNAQRPSQGNAGSTSAGGASSANNSGSSGSASGAASGGQQSMGSSVSNGQAVVNYAMQFVGNPYVYGGTSLTNGADCSGFVQSVYAAFGVSLPRNSTAQRSAGYAVSVSDIRPGDLVCYSGHIGIYAGNNTLVHASNERTGITTTSPINYRPILAVRRIF